MLTERIKDFQISSAKYVFTLELSLRQDITSFCQFNPNGAARQFQEFTPLKQEAMIN
jgi:hypothetical protein